MSSLPYTASAGTTCGLRDKIGPANAPACGSSSALIGQDAVWESVAPQSGLITVSVSGTADGASLRVYRGGNLGICEGLVGATRIAHLDDISGAGSIDFCAVNGEKYYVILDYDPFIAGNNCGSYADLTISAPSVNLPGITTVSALPYSTGIGTTCGQKDKITANNAPACGVNAYRAGEDHIWTFQPSNSGRVVIDLTSTTANSALTLYKGVVMCRVRGSSVQPVSQILQDLQGINGSSPV